MKNTEPAASTGKKLDLRTREESVAIVAKFLQPHVKLVYNRNLSEETRERAAAKPTNISVEARKIEAEYGVFGVHLRPDLETIEYSDASAFHMLLHEAAHVLFLRNSFDYETHAPDLLGWTHALKNGGHPFVGVEEMCVSFLGFIWLAKLDLVPESIFFDQCPREVAEARHYPKKSFPTELIAPLLDERFLVDDGRIFLSCDADFNPVFRLKAATPFASRAELNHAILTNPVFRGYGINYFRYAGILDGEAGIRGRLNREEALLNRDGYRDLFKFNEAAVDDLMNFIIA